MRTVSHLSPFNLWTPFTSWWAFNSKWRRMEKRRKEKATLFFFVYLFGDVCWCGGGGTFSKGHETTIIPIQFLKNFKNFLIK